MSIDNEKICSMSLITFRFLVLISFFSNMLWVFYRDIFWDYFDGDLQSLLSIDGYGSILPGADYIFWFVLTMSIVCYIGLFFLRYWAVWLLIILDIVLLMILAPFGGVEVQIPIERITKTLFTVIDGMIIASVFFSDFKSKIIK